VYFCREALENAARGDGHRSTRRLATPQATMGIAARGVLSHFTPQNYAFFHKTQNFRAKNINYTL